MNNIEWSGNKDAFLAQAIALSLQDKPYVQATFLGRAVNLGILTMSQAEQTWGEFGVGPDDARAVMIKLARGDKEVDEPRSAKRDIGDLFGDW